MLVHSFDRGNASLDDYMAFADGLGFSGAGPDALTSVKRLDGINLRLGWVKHR